MYLYFCKTQKTYLIIYKTHKSLQFPVEMNTRGNSDYSFIMGFLTQQVISVARVIWYEKYNNNNNKKMPVPT